MIDFPLVARFTSGTSYKDIFHVVKPLFEHLLQSKRKFCNNVFTHEDRSHLHANSISVFLNKQFQCMP
jgi:hypothetical protein